MIFKSQNVSLILAGFVALLTCLSLTIVEGVSFFAYIIIFGSAFLATYFISYLIFEFIIFKELREFYNRVGHVGGASYELLNLDKMNLKKMSNELFRFANKKEAEIKKLKKMESFRREFLADISHELKTPIFAAQGFIHTLIDGAKDDEKVRDRFLKKAAKSLDNLDLLVKDLISISQLETGEFKLEMDEFDLNKLVIEEVEQFEHKAKKKGVNLIYDLPREGDFFVEADYYRIAQVFQNLINNGLNYAGEGSTVSIELKRNGPYIDVIVSDNGVGISSDHVNRIFNRFYRIDKSRSREKGGSGLGLSIVKHIVDAHDSAITVSSKPGEGATFYFSLKAIEPIHED